MGVAYHVDDIRRMRHARSGHPPRTKATLDIHGRLTNYRWGVFKSVRLADSETTMITLKLESAILSSSHRDRMIRAIQNILDFG